MRGHVGDFEVTKNGTSREKHRYGNSFRDANSFFSRNRSPPSRVVVGTESIRGDRDAVVLDIGCIPAISFCVGESFALEKCH